MISLPQNRIFRALVIATTVAVVICYTWLAARLLEPRFEAPPFVSETFIRTPDARLSLFDERSHQFPRETERLQTELSTLEPLLNWLGPLKQPIEILIDEKDSMRLLVTDSRIEIGGDVLIARGQMSKAVMKAWLLQNSSLAITSSQLRVEVASDVLLAMLVGDLRLGVPGSPDAPLKFDADVKPWFAYADSYSGVCESGWRSIELAPLCKSEDETISSLSFRPFLGAQIWKSYLSLPMSQRLPFIHHWVGAMAELKTANVPSLKDGWRAVVESELETLLPAVLDPLADERLTWPTRVEVPMVVVDSKGVMTAPGSLRSMSTELPIAHARFAMMTECSPPTVDEILSLKVNAERVVWKPDCAERKSDFIQARPSALRLALARGLLTRDMKLDDFILKNAQSQAMGLADAKWDARLNAFQVRGAIQAVELFRLGTRETSSGATTAAPAEPQQPL